MLETAQVKKGISFVETLFDAQAYNESAVHFSSGLSLTTTESRLGHRRRCKGKNSVGC